jgi:hypothetical protein
MPAATALDDLFDDVPEDTVVENLIALNLAAHKLSILPELELTDVVANFVTKQEKDSILNYLNRTIDATKSHLELNDELEDDKKLQDAIVMVKETRARDYEQNVGDRPVQRATVSLTVDPRDFERGENVDLRKFGLDSSQNGFVAKRVLMKKGGSKRTVSTTKRLVQEGIAEEQPTSSRRRKIPKPKPVSSESEMDEDHVEDQLPDVDDVEEVPVSPAKAKSRSTASKGRAPKMSTKPSRTTKQTTLSTFANSGWSQLDDEIDDGIQIVETRTPVSSQSAPPLVLTEMNSDNTRKRKALPSSLSSQKSKVPAARSIRKSKFS